MKFLSILKDILDIFSLAAILFFVYRLTVKRKAFKLTIGVALFLLATFVVEAVDFTALGLVFQNIRQLGFTALLIIFQPELRSALEKIGGSTFDGIQNINHAGDKKDVASAQSVIEAVSRSAQDLSDIKYGALIVIERGSSLDEYKESGAYLDSMLTAEALNAIFYKGAAFHDGATIIRNGRIDYARCVLPMTSRVDIPSELGTRHRAALGLSEKTDAIVVVVSEETGKISISMNGELERGYTYATLRSRLDEILNTNKPASRTSNRRGAKKSKRLSVEKPVNTPTIDKVNKQS